MIRFQWTEQAIEALDALTAADARDLLHRLDLLAEFPALYPTRQRGRLSGHRYFVVRKRWVVYYQLPDEHTVTIVTILAARSRTP